MLDFNYNISNINNRKYIYKDNQQNIFTANPRILILHIMQS